MVETAMLVSGGVGIGWMGESGLGPWLGMYCGIVTVTVSLRSGGSRSRTEMATVDGTSWFTQGVPNRLSLNERETSGPDGKVTLTRWEGCSKVCWVGKGLLRAPCSVCMVSAPLSHKERELGGWQRLQEPAKGQSGAFLLVKEAAC